MGRFGRLAVPDIVPVLGICPVVRGVVIPGLTRPGAGVAGATPGGADPGDKDGAVAVPVGLPPEIPDETPDDDPVDDPVPVLWAYAETLKIATNPAARMSFCDISFSPSASPSKGIPRHQANVQGYRPVPDKFRAKASHVLRTAQKEGVMDQATGETADIEYSYKPSLMGGVWTFRLAPEGLQWSVGVLSGQVAYRDIRRIRMSFRPVTMQSYRFLTEVWSDRHPKLPIVSSSWKSLTEQERFDKAYTRFVIALHERIAAAKGSPQLQAGAVPFLYWPGAVIFVAICLATIGILVRALQQGETMATLFLLAFFAFLVWQLGRFFKRNLPRRYTLDAIPSDVLPISRD